MDLRERRKQATRATIEHTALELFRRRGFAETTVDELCAHAEIGRRTFFRHFASKEDVLLDRLRVDIARVSETFRVADPDDPLEALLTRSIAAVVADDDAFATFAEVVLEVPALRALYLGMLAGFEDALVALLSERFGRPPGDEDVRLTSAAAVTGFRVGVHFWINSPPGTDLPTTVRRTVRALLPREHPEQSGRQDVT